MWPTISYNEDGRIRVVDGLAVVFFVNVHHRDCAEDIASAIERIVSFAGLTALRFFVDDEGDARPLTTTVYRSLITELRQSAAQGEGGLSLIGDDASITGTDAYYFGEAEPSDERPTWRNVLKFHLCRDLFMERGAEQVRSFVRSLAQTLPFSFGYASPCLCYGHNIVRAAKIARRYPGFDILDPGAAATSIGNKMAGVYWLSFFGQALVDSLGGTEQIQGLLRGLAEVTPLPKNKLEMLIEETPTVGDLNRKDNLPAYRAVARVVEPHLHLPTITYFREDDGITANTEAMIAWHRRFLD